MWLCRKGVTGGWGICSLEEGTHGGRQDLFVSLMGGEPMGERTGLSLQQGKDLQAKDLQRAGEVVRSLSLEVCKRTYMPLCQKLFWDEQAKETHSSGM